MKNSRRPMKKTKSQEIFIDLTPRANISIEPYDISTLSDEDFKRIMLDVERASNEVYNDYYSTDASIERVVRRTFWDLIKAKLYTMKEEKSNNEVPKNKCLKRLG